MCPRPFPKNKSQQNGDTNLYSPRIKYNSSFLLKSKLWPNLVKISFIKYKISYNICILETFKKILNDKLKDMIKEGFVDSS